jgi:threonine/homoserine efflux transporter RhtA
VERGETCAQKHLLGTLHFSIRFKCVGCALAIVLFLSDGGRSIVEFRSPYYQVLLSFVFHPIPHQPSSSKTHTFYGLYGVVSIL